MCRLYGFHATEETKVECTLVYAQNALLAQSWRDRAGRRHADGWGLAAYNNSMPAVERMAIPAYHGQHFASAASRLYARTVVAHVRAATVGKPALENTHPFTTRRWTFAHNGTIRNFAALRERFLAAMGAEHRALIRGGTDSEHLFHLLLATHDAAPRQPVDSILRTVFSRVSAWNKTEASGGDLAMNVVWTDGRVLVASRLGRPLWMTQRDGLRDCEVCGFPHVHHYPGTAYRAIVVASEPLSDEAWEEIPDNRLLIVDAGAHVRHNTLL